VLRSTGFPVSGLERLAAPGLAVTADRHLAGTVAAGEFARAYAAARSAASTELDRIAGDDRLREAAAWEPAHATAGLADLPDEPAGERRRAAEHRLARLWQRYCALNDTIGFFGPFRWMPLDPAQPATVAEPGPSMLSLRKMFFEPWALAAYGASLAKDPAVRRWLPPYPRTHQSLVGSAVHRPGRPPEPLTPAEAAALTACDGRRPGMAVAALLAERAVVPDVAAGLALLDRLVARRLLEWDENLPVTPRTEELLDERVAAIGDPAVRQRAAAGLIRLRAATDGVAAAVGDPDALPAAIATLDREFTALTGRPARRPGHGHPGHAVAYEDTLRDVRPALGRPVLDAVEPALDLVLGAARWLTAELADRFDAALAGLVGAVAADRPSLADIWDAAVDRLLGPPESSLFTGVLEEFEARWLRLLDLDGDGGASRRDYTADALRERADELFRADRPGWSMARVHSPDLLLAAPSAEAIDAGAYTAVLGELHIAYATLLVRTMTWALPDPDRYLEYVVDDYGRHRLIPLMPRLWSDYAGRSLQFDDTPSDRYVGFARATGADAARVVPTCAVAIEENGLTGRLPDGTPVPLREFFAVFLSMSVTNALREVLHGRHTPRVTIDRLVVWRETWRLDGTEIAALADADEAAAYLAGRRLVAARGLPARCFARLSTEKKPVYVDFTSPAFVGMLAALLRSARAKSPGLDVTLTEMVPGPEGAWLRDAEGNRYLSEFRLHVTDPARAR